MHTYELPSSAPRNGYTDQVAAPKKEMQKKGGGIKVKLLPSDALI